MKVIIGLFLAFAGLWASADHLGQSLSTFWDTVAFLMVVLGTAAVAIITMPILNFKVITKEFFKSFASFNKRREKAIGLCVKILNKKESPKLGDNFNEKIIGDGMELIQLGLSAEKIDEILYERVHHYSQDCLRVANWITGLSKYPPAFGLAGTILGLTELMRNLSQGADSKQTGLSMAIALVATLYGVLLSNLIINPIGERLKTTTRENQLLCEISIKTVLMMKEQTNLLEAQEQLNAYLVASNKKFNLIEGLSEAA